MSRFLFYAGSGLDRAAQHRRNEPWIASHLSGIAADCRLLPVWRSLHPVSRTDEPRPVSLTLAEGRAFLESASDLVFLGCRAEVAHFAIDLSPLDEGEVRAHLDGDLADLRVVGSLLPGEDAALLAYARAILHWHRQHRFCGACGSPTRSEAAGHVRRCSREGCALEHFPRTDPAVIMLVSDGDRCLLGRQSRWPPGMVSTLAGFVEPGESLEEAVAREVLEEVGVVVRDVVYRGSQPWPFPCSVMLGFQVAAATSEIRIDRDELEHAAWYSRAEVRCFGEADFRNFQPPPEGAHLLPPRDSIARWLIEGWMVAR